ncbi:MAG TPA: sigma-70 family RNA polymerase sigma factor [Methylomirabilota bacterium]|jgi:RNA polymerase sigma-70 factor (ECF subfamily)|nr:sigma-70 family RNA polymerase sigma factor [Methylomirabilota bacterium]
MRGCDEALSPEATYEELYARHYPRVLRMCRLLLADAHEAEEVGQEVFLKLHQALQTGAPLLSCGAWLTRVAVNACHDRHRAGWWKWWRERGERLDERHCGGMTRTPEDEAIGHETRGRIWRSFGGLPRRQREVFVLRQLEGFSTSEVAGMLGMSAGSVKQHLFRAIRHLRAALGDRP